MDIKNSGSLNYSAYLSYLLIIITLIVPYLFSIDSYQIIPNESIVINKVVGNVIIPFSNMQQIEVIDSKKLWMSIRLFGSGGLYGYFGTFYNKEYGRMKWYATQRKNCIVIITKDNKKILITPDNLKDILELLPKDLLSRKDLV